MDVRVFFQSLFPVRSQSALREEKFLLTYHAELSGAEVEEMDCQERVWWLKRLTKQFKMEADAIKGKKSSARVEHEVE